MNSLVSKYKNLLVVLIIPILFLIVGIATLSDFGMNWDESFHFMRGHAYLNFYLTGEEDYSNLLSFPRLSDKCDDWVNDCKTTPSVSDKEAYREDERLYEEAVWSENIDNNQDRRSYYQSDRFTYNYFINERDQGHPPANGIMAALSNTILYQKLGVFSDIESYHFFEVFLAFLIVAGVAVFVYFEFGLFSSFVASFSLAVYPLFFSESHFNIKDPVETSFFGLTIIFYYFGITKNKWYLILSSSILAGLALGTKFNAVFLPFVIIPWLVFYVCKLIKKRNGLKIKKKESKRILLLVLSILFYPVIVLTVFYAFWPYLWQDPIGHMVEIVGYYQSIGTTLPENLGRFLVNGWNTYPIIWILYTTPIPILLLSCLGIVWSAFQIVWKKKHVFFLVLLWFLVPIVRVSRPNSAIYGGIRQIMEFVPAMAVLAGIGAASLVRVFEKTFYKRKWVGGFVTVIIVTSLSFILREMITIHPNENVYFNQLAGGLSGAKEKEIPSWGNSYGNAYLQGIKWINENAEPGARVALPIGDVSKLYLRSDIVLYNGYWSGPDRRGEYLLENDFDWPPKNLYSFAYVDTFLEPVYKVEVDGVSILKVWKNDLEHVKEGFENEREFGVRHTEYDNNQLTIDLGKEVFLTRVKINHSTFGCQDLQSEGYISVSSDGKVWQRQTELLKQPQFPNEALEFLSKDLVSDKDTLTYLFPATKARYIMIHSQVDNACIFSNPSIEVWGLTTSSTD